MSGLFDLSGKVSLVTGGSRGIGLAMAEGLAASGSDVVIWDVSEERNEQARRKLEAHGRRVRTMLVDVSKESEVVEAMAAVVGEMGRIDTAIANAGVAGRAPSFLDLTTEELRRVLSINLEGVFVTLREAARP